MILMFITVLSLWALQLAHLREQRNIPSADTQQPPQPPVPPQSPMDNQMEVPSKEAA